MEYVKAKVVKLLVNFFEDDFRRITHALRVLTEAERIAQSRQDYDEDILVTVALLHDVGIKESEKRFGYNNGKTQEQLGPSAAEILLQRIDFPAEKIEVVKNIIGNHHSPSRFDYAELAILKEADKIVNRFEEGR